jgi:NADPH:quinone reductase-like Zn-dependent oxidoreductase
MEGFVDQEWECGERNILVTGIGGGVALNVLQFAVALGLNTYVTSGNEEKIEKAKEMGAKGGVNYKNDAWEKDLKKLLPKDRPYIDTIIDGAGGNIVAKAVRLLKVCSLCSATSVVEANVCSLAELLCSME